MLYLDVDWLNNLWEEARQDDSGQRMRHPTHYRDIALYHQYCALNDLLFDDVPPELKEEALIGFLVGLSPETTLAPEITPKWVPAMQKKLLQHCEHHWSITHLAAEVGLSRFHLIRIFRRHTGLTPHAYLLDCRINKARHLLREGVSLAELAQHLGFSDQSHFQKAFRQRVCATPGDYLQQMRR
ncbi:MAG: transcriptional regulator, AraC family [Burkholderiaceae bacterium]|nr:transcriptional regulator, AraC family [Burkholderiaceae bacterium]